MTVRTEKRFTASIYVRTLFASFKCWMRAQLCTVVTTPRGLLALSFHARLTKFGASSKPPSGGRRDEFSQYVDP